MLFFVSVGMLFDPKILLQQPLAVAATLLIIVIGKSFTAWLIVLLFGHPRKTALTIAASLAQIGEFAFMLSQLGVTLGLLSLEAYEIVLAGSILSIILNPVLFVKPSLSVVARAHSDAEVEHLKQHGAQAVIMGEREIARRMLDCGPSRRRR